MFEFLKFKLLLRGVHENGVPPDSNAKMFPEAVITQVLLSAVGCLLFSDFGVIFSWAFQQSAVCFPLFSNSNICFSALLDGEFHGIQIQRSGNEHFRA